MNPRHKILIAVSAVLTLIALMGLHASTLIGSTLVIRNLREELASAPSVDEQIDLEKQVQLDQHRIDILSTASLSDVLRQFTNDLGDLDVTERKITTDVTATYHDCRLTSVNVAFIGPLESAFRFMRAIDRRPNVIVRLQQLGITHPDSTSSDSLIVSLHLIVVTRRSS